MEENQSDGTKISNIVIALCSLQNNWVMSISKRVELTVPVTVTGQRRLILVTNVLLSFIDVAKINFPWLWLWPHRDRDCAHKSRCWPAEVRCRPMHSMLWGFCFAWTAISVTILCGCHDTGCNYYQNCSQQSQCHCPYHVIIVFSHPTKQYWVLSVIMHRALAVYCLYLHEETQ